MSCCKPIRILVWNEFQHEKTNEEVKKIYPHGMHVTIAESLTKLLGEEAVVKTATLDEPEHGLTVEALDNTDTLIWWAHKAHAQVQDEIAERVYQRVVQGMGMLVLHSGHFSKPFKKLMGTGCGIRWREAGEMERFWVIDPSHPVTDGLPPYFELEHEEMYGEHFDVPTPDELVLISWFEGGNVVRSGCGWNRGKGKVFYFRPGHETYPTYHDANVQRIIANAARHVACKTSTYYKFGATPDKVPLNPIKNMTK